MIIDQAKYVYILFLTFLSYNLFSQSNMDYVDLFVCTADDHGQLDPSATVPFGMVKLGPDTEPRGHSGYNYNADKLLGFSHNRVGGVGCKGVGGNIRILPLVSEKTEASVAMNKQTEAAQPGYYTVTLEEEIKAELTATNHTGIHRYTFPKSKEACIRIDYKSAFGELFEAEYNTISNNTINGYASASSVCTTGRYFVYYHIESNKDFVRYEEKDGYLFAYFQTEKSEQVELQVTLSPISTEQAAADVQATLSNKSFDEVRDEAYSKWEDLMNRIEVEGKEEYKRLFYTHLYHCYLNPVNSTSSSGTYKGTDNKVYEANGYTHYDSWSIWDNFRNKFSLYALTIPEQSSDFGRSLVDLYKSGKSKWLGFYEPVPTIRAEFSSLVLLDMHKRGVKGIDFESIYNELCHEAAYTPSGVPDKILESAYTFWGLAQIADILDKPEDYEVFMSKAMSYKKKWRRNFLKIGDDADVMHARGIYEGTIWQYRWHVQFDVDGIIEMIGGKEKYIEQLTYFFDNHLYNHGNQPDIHVPFMFNFGDAPWLTQKWVNMILTKDMVQHYGTHKKWKEPYYGRVYKATPDGYIKEMDDDEGTMSSWYVLSSMGIHPVLVGEPVFQVSTPIFDKVTIHLENGKDFVIEARNLSDESFYIQSATLNGEDFNQSYIDHADLMNGGKLIYELSDQPNKNWGVK